MYNYGGKACAKNDYLFYRFLGLCCIIIGLDYVEEGQLNLQYNLSRALFIIAFIRVAFWFTHKMEKESDEETGKQ